MKFLVTMLAVALTAASCSKGVSRIETHSLSSPNPTGYAFPLSMEEVHTKGMEAFSDEHQIAQPIFGRSTAAAHLEAIFAAECATNAVFGKAVFNDPTNNQDIYLCTMHSPFVLSSVYRGQDGGLPFIASFHLHLTANDSNTTVSVITVDAEVINGTKFGAGPCGPGQGNNYVPVKPTTIEEYTILRYLGQYLGFTNMPEVILPKI